MPLACVTRWRQRPSQSDAETQIGCFWHDVRIGCNREVAPAVNKTVLLHWELRCNHPVTTEQYLQTNTQPRPNPPTSTHRSAIISSSLRSWRISSWNNYQGRGNLSKRASEQVWRESERAPATLLIGYLSGWMDSAHDGYLWDLGLKAHPDHLQCCPIRLDLKDSRTFFLTCSRHFRW